VIAEIYIYDVALTLMVTIMRLMVKLKLQGPSGEGCDLRLAPAMQCSIAIPRHSVLLVEFIMMHIEGESKNYIYGKTMH